MMVVFIATLFISSVASAQGIVNSNAGGLDAEQAARIAADADLQNQIDTIEPTPWTDTNDGYNSISTIGSIKIGDDQNRDYCDTRNEGTIRFNTDTKKFEGCNGTVWVSLSSLGLGSDHVHYAIGDTGPAGGIVFYTTDGGLHGLESAPADQSLGAPWGCRGTSIAGAGGTAVGTGAQNTADILAGCSVTGIAAQIADDYTLGGYDDWFLPSKGELNKLYQQRNVVGEFAFDGYWSSTKLDSHDAWAQIFTIGIQYYPSKSNPLRVRAVRAF
jgi:hypothetical protein